MPVYLDNNATTTMPEQVVAVMMPYLTQTIGNPSSVHRYGRLSRQAIDDARVQVAALVNAEPSQVIFTSGGTEANNLAILGSCKKWQNARLAIAATEHPSVIEPAQMHAQESGFLDIIAVTDQGLITDAAFKQVLHDDTRLISVMLANNETGVIQDLIPFIELAKSRGIWFHADVSQAVAKIEVDIKQLPVQLMTLSSHKIYGPRGIGALIIDKSIEIDPIIVGGGQEKNLRSGTENIAAIVGFGKAAELAKKELQSRAELLAGMQAKLEDGLHKIPSVRIFADKVKRLPNTTLFAIEGIEGETLLMQLDKKGFAVSSGSACHSSKVEASHVLQAMGVDDRIGSAAIRVSLGIDNTLADVEGFIRAISEILETLRPNLSLAVNNI
ncbi:MAG: cysteine desulfurase [Gammaproteobacteria bacterium]|nr:cysteine desulfurase [Gammaproteobacteria bacterium]